MNRLSFIALYASGIGAVGFAGSPWLALNAVLMGAPKSLVLMSTSFWLALFSPVALVIVAALRGKAIARPRLFLLPVCAFGLSALAFAYGWLSRAVTGEEASILPMLYVVAMGVTSFFGPLVIHVVCCTIGALERPSRTREALQ